MLAGCIFFLPKKLKKKKDFNFEQPKKENILRTKKINKEIN